MHVVMRLVSLILVLAGMTLLGADVITSLESISKGGPIYLRTLEELWAMVGDVEGFKIWCNNELPAALSAWIYSMLTVPGWALFGVFGVVIGFVFGRRTHE